MAVFPCDWLPHRYPQAQQSIYINYVCNDITQTRALRLCPRDFEEAEAQLERELRRIDDDSQMSTICEHCPEVRVCAIFARSYPQHGEAAAFAADLCGPCGERVLEHLRFASGRLLQTR